MGKEFRALPTRETTRERMGSQGEALRGDLKGFHSVRVNDQWRVIFKWTPDGPDAVDVVDYH